MTVVGDVAVAVALAECIWPVAFSQYAYSVMDCPALTDVDEIPYDPFFVFVAHAVVEVGTVADVVMQASVTGAPEGSFTMPVIVIAIFVALGTGVGATVCTGVGGAVRAGVAVGGGDDGS